VVLHPTQHKIGNFKDVPQANLLASYRKTKLTQEKHTFTNKKKCTNKHKKSKSMFCHLLWHPAWKWRGPIMVSVLHKFVTYLLTYLLRHLPLTYSPGPTRGKQRLKI